MLKYYLKKTAFITYILFTFYLLVTTLVQKNSFYIPSMTKKNLLPVLHQSSFSKEDYTLLYEQTGLTKPIIDELSNDNDFIEKILMYQTHYFSPVRIQCKKLNFFTRQDFMEATNEVKTPSFVLAPYHNGYLLFTKSTHTINFRHGHVGMVVDEKRGKTIEALHPGTISVEQDISKWQFYPTFKMMRLKNTSYERQNAIAQYAAHNMYNIPYGITAKKRQSFPCTSTHCALLVWECFKAFGFDLDANGGKFVFPKDLARSPLLEPLQIYGFDPQKDW